MLDRDGVVWGLGYAQVGVGDRDRQLATYEPLSGNIRSSEAFALDNEARDVSGWIAVGFRRSRPHCQRQKRVAGLTASGRQQVADSCYVTSYK